MTAKNNINGNGSKKAKNETTTHPIYSDSDELYNRILVKQCEVIFNSDDNNDTIYLSAENVIENCIKFYLKDKSKDIDFIHMEFFALIANIRKNQDFEEYIGFFTLVRLKRNKVHEELESARDINLLILKLTFYKFIKWFVCEFLRKDEIDVAKQWYIEFTGKLNNTTLSSCSLSKLKENNSAEEIHKINLRLDEYEKKLAAIANENYMGNLNIVTSQGATSVEYVADDENESSKSLNIEIEKPEPSLEDTILFIKKLLLEIDYDDGSKIVKYTEFVFNRDNDEYCIINFKKKASEKKVENKILDEEDYWKGKKKPEPIKKVIGKVDFEIDDRGNIKEQEVFFKFRLIDVNSPPILGSNKIYFDCRKPPIKRPAKRIPVGDGTFHKKEEQVVEIINAVEINDNNRFKMTDEFEIYFSNLTIGEKLLSAFKHAIELANERKNKWYE